MAFSVASLFLRGHMGRTQGPVKIIRERGPRLRASTLAELSGRGLDAGVAPNPFASPNSSGWRRSRIVIAQPGMRQLSPPVAGDRPFPRIPAWRKAVNPSVPPRGIGEHSIPKMAASEPTYRHAATIGPGRASVPSLPVLAMPGPFAIDADTARYVPPSAAASPERDADYRCSRRSRPVWGCLHSWNHLWHGSISDCPRAAPGDSQSAPLPTPRSPPWSCCIRLADRDADGSGRLPCRAWSAASGFLAVGRAVIR